VKSTHYDKLREEIALFMHILSKYFFVNYGFLLIFQIFHVIIKPNQCDRYLRASSPSRIYNRSINSTPKGEHDVQAFQTR